MIETCIVDTKYIYWKIHVYFSSRKENITRSKTKHITQETKYNVKRNKVYLSLKKCQRKKVYTYR